MKKIQGSFWIALLSLPFIIKSQTVSINGIVNLYEPVVAIDTVSCPAKLTVPSTAGFAPNDEVLLIQMKGAKFDTSNTANFGTLADLNGAGSYEIARISNIFGNIISVNGKLLNKYDLSGRIQLIRIPQYVNANVTGVLTCPPWNGTTGGVVILRAQNNLQLNANIDVTGRGFRGGIISKNPNGGCGAGSPLYHYNLYQGAFNWNAGGAQKGEGIGDIDTVKQGGRGPLVNGGGGGNKHNTGGGGGSNYTAGGKGGDGLEGCGATQGGLGGKSLAAEYNNQKLFLGGGGGCGDDNDLAGSDGVDGGGIVIILVGTIAGNGNSIKADGRSVTIIGSGIADGAGGGGAGGSIFIDAAAVTGNVIVQANGGDGGDQSPTYGCVGPGGGGGTGAILTSAPALTGLIPFQIAGTAGIVSGTSFPCNNTSYGATWGVSNNTGILADRRLVFTPDASTSCNKATSVTSEAFRDFKLNIYPDPANAVISWRNRTPQASAVSVAVSDCTGRLIYSGQADNTETQSLHIEFLENGVYLLQVTDGTQQYSGRFVKN